ncbi:hydrogenase 4 subunit B [Paludibacterium purpuratum]|uniref:Hydrogenase-4 component B n=1 Tax=Paludibacterium purpuratum TaxID=1144873 RepID=A0A4R7B7H3_9NEIS|nr:hydrogenase 4 subunit B [Paludibacterium purpuratum]TDR79666.1 hydrogenase-4 component B [Paludibacterium purpuratum]
MSLTPLGCLLLSVLLFLAGAVLSAVLARCERLAINLSALAGVAGGVAGLFAAAPVLLSGHTELLTVAGPFAFAHFTARLDMFSALMVAVISLLALVASLYAQSYVREYQGRGAWAMGLFMNSFIAAMLALVAVDNAFWFLVFFEAMSLASYFLVIFDQDEESVGAGLLYFLIAHAGSVLIMIAFFILYSHSGSLDFQSFRTLRLPLPTASLVFVLAFLGFGAKAGMVPLHSWLPRAHPAAPSHGSAMMSGVMVKIGVFGIVKVGIDLLGAQASWWGLLVLAVGAVSAVLGVLYALAEQDIKRLLAYSTVENVGIILMGVGAGMIGLATGHVALASLALMAAFYHLFNHALFKGLMFFGAGSILYRTHTRDMTQLGGLARRMPLTALAFLVGAMSICALPPFNGFVSEWFSYQALFAMSHDGDFMMRLAGPVAMVMLALTGALAAMCFVKAWGMSFSGQAQSEHAEHAEEAPFSMVLAMGVLAVLCVLSGIGAPWLAPLFARVAASLTGGFMVPVAQGLALHSGQLNTPATVSTPLLALLLLAAPLLPFLLVGALRGSRMTRRHGGDAWACGYATERSMTVSPQGFVQPVRFMFGALYRLRETLSPAAFATRGLNGAVAGATRVEPLWDEYLIAPIVAGVQKLARRVAVLQRGDFRVYCLYVVVALVTLLLISVR